MAREGYLAFLLFLVSVALLALAVNAAEESRDLFITMPETDYDIGSEAYVNVCVCVDGDLVDVDEVELKVGRYNRPVNLTRWLTGMYSGLFTVEAYDLDMDGYIYVWAKATFINSTTGASTVETEAERFRTCLADALSIQIVVPDIDDEHVDYGQVVEFEVRSFFNGTPVDPDAGTLEIGSTVGTCEFIRTDTGVYESQFTAPTTQWEWFNESTRLRIMAEANYTTKGWTGTTKAYREILLNHFEVWFHELEVVDETVRMEVVVLDRDGVAVEGANITLEYSDTQWEALEHFRGTLHGRTDPDGAAGFTLDFAGLNETLTTIYFLGEVEHAGKSQNFDERIVVRRQPPGPEEPPEPTDLLFSDRPLPPDTILMLNATLVTGTPPLPSIRVVVYVWTSGRVLCGRELYTDANGNISVDFQTPKLVKGERFTYLWIRRIVWRDGAISSTANYQRIVGERPPTDFWDRWVDGSTSVTVTRLGHDGPVRVMLDDPDADGSNERAGVAWGFGTLPYGSVTFDAPWRQTRLHCCDWSPDSPLSWVSVVECEWNGSGYVAVVELPAFIDNVTALWFYGAIQFLDSPTKELHGAFLENVTPISVGDLPPGISVEHPTEGSTCWGELVARGTAWDDFAVRAVEVRLDGGEWTRPDGMPGWTYAIDTKDLAWGEHILEARSFDGFFFSELVRVTFRVDNPPARPTADLPGDEWLMGVVPVNGTATDDGGVVRVEVRVDLGGWATVGGTSLWLHMLDTTALRWGEHTLSARSFDGTHWSETLELAFLVDNPPAIDRFIVVLIPEEPTTVEVHGTADDDHGVELVEYRLGIGDWTPANGTDNWRFSFDTRAHDYGDLTVRVRAFDGRRYSDVESVIIVIDNYPEITSVGLTEGQWVDGIVEVRGTAWDDDRVVQVEVKVDQGPWVRAEGTASWLHMLDTEPLDRGPHTLYARAYDGSHWSLVVEVGFVVDQRPRLTIRRPVAGAVCNGTIVVDGTAWDDGQLHSVEISVDDGPWVAVERLSVWRFELDTTTLSAGSHRLWVRGFDGAQYSAPVEVLFDVDQPPSVSFIAPDPSSRCSGELTISGTATDDVAVTLVEWRVDGDSWHIASGTTVWSDSVDCAQLSEGAHTLEVRCFDGVSRSGTASVSFEVYREDTSPGAPREDLLDWALLVIVVVLVVVIVALLLVRRFRR